MTWIDWHLRESNMKVEIDKQTNFESDSISKLAPCMFMIEYLKREQWIGIGLTLIPQ